ncbi:hypothetical protein K438DRAFT_1754161 [Mycena galopus ATCC 62051]|nr:hypothetical protein K438DRAFT_1754161 [Mycena galopus ATCC 62051]
MPCIVKARPPRKTPKVFRFPLLIIRSTSADNDSNQSGKKPPSPPLPFPCLAAGCPWSYPRAYDLRRHGLTHMCPEERAAQPSSTGEKPEMCDDCTYTTGDPASLTAHRKKAHGYAPRGAKLLQPDGHAAAPLQMANGYAARASSSYSAPSSSYASSSSSSSPGSLYSTRSPESWGVSPSSYASGSSSHGPSPGYSAYPLNANFAYLSSMVAPPPSHPSWGGGADIVFDTAPNVGFPLVDVDACTLPAPAYSLGLIPPTARPGPTALYPAASLSALLQLHLQPAPDYDYAVLSDAELCALLAHAVGLHTDGPGADTDAETFSAAPSSSSRTEDRTALPYADQVAASCAWQPQPQPQPVPQAASHELATSRSDTELRPMFSRDGTP